MTIIVVIVLSENFWEGSIEESIGAYFPLSNLDAIVKSPLKRSRLLHLARWLTDLIQHLVGRRDGVHFLRDRQWKGNRDMTGQLLQRCFFLIPLILTAFEVRAITWEFDEEGNTQGWVAREGEYVFYRAMLRSEVRDGIWRIFPVPFEPERRDPHCLLISPRIDRDSALFDRITIRFRVVHTRPFNALLGVSWTNEYNQNLLAEEPELSTGISTLDFEQCLAVFSLAPCPPVGRVP